MHRARALSSKVNNNRENGHCCNFLYRFSTFCEKNEENLSSRTLNNLQNAPSNSVHLTSLFSYAAVSNAIDSLIQNIIKIVCLC